MREYFGVRIPFADFCGLEPVSYGGGEAAFALQLEPQHENSLGMAHGGLVLTMLDLALSAAARSNLDGESTVMTIDMQASFLAPARGRLLAKGRTVRAGRSIIFAEGDLFDGDGALCARATGVFRPTPKKSGRPTGGDA